MTTKWDEAHMDTRIVEILQGVPLALEEGHAFGRNRDLRHFTGRGAAGPLP